MPVAQFSVQNFIGSKLKLNTDWVVSLADLLHRNKGCFSQ